MTPFTIDQLEERYGPASSAPDIDRVTYARRSDGSVAHSYCFDCARDGSGKPTVEYVDAMNLIIVQFEPVTKSITSRPVQAADFADEINMVIRGCDGSEKAAVAEPATILGYEVIKVTDVDKFGAECDGLRPV